MGDRQISEQVERVPCPCLGQWEMTGHHGVKLTCRWVGEVLPSSWKGLFLLSGELLSLFTIFKTLGSVTHRAELPHLAGRASSKWRSAKKKNLLWVEHAVTVRLGEISFLSFFFNDQRVSIKDPSWGPKLVEVASTKEQGGGMTVPAGRDVSLAPTRPPNLNSRLFFFFEAALHSQMLLP